MLSNLLTAKVDVTLSISKPFFFFLYTDASMPYGNSPARGQIKVTVEGLQHSYGNTGSELHLQPTLHCGNARSLSTEQGQD